MVWNQAGGPAVAALIALALASACGAKIGERTVSDGWRNIALKDPSSDPEYAQRGLAERRKSHGHVLRPPHWIAGGGQAAKNAASARSIVHLEISIYGKISCSDPRGAEAVPAERLGEPQQRERVWIVPAEVDGDAPFAFGPAWLGNFLRSAAPGDAIHFPPYQDCAAMSEAIPEQVPRRVFAGWQDVTINARTPFVARVLEICPAELKQRAESLRSYHIPIVTWGYSIGTSLDRTRTTARVTARCASSEVSFELGPLVPQGVYPHGDPPAAIKSTPP